MKGTEKQFPVNFSPRKTIVKSFDENVFGFFYCKHNFKDFFKNGIMVHFFANWFFFKH